MNQIGMELTIMCAMSVWSIAFSLGCHEIAKAIMRAVPKTITHAGTSNVVIHDQPRTPSHLDTHR